VSLRPLSCGFLPGSELLGNNSLSAQKSGKLTKFTEMLLLTTIHFQLLTLHYSRPAQSSPQVSGREASTKLVPKEKTENKSIGC
jgi:hypothetical protein